MDKASIEIIKGLGLIVGGVVLLLYTFGLVQKGISFLLILVALALILYGLMISGIYEHIMKMFHHKK